MLGFVHNFVAPPSHPIGIDLDGCTLRMAQVHTAGDAFRLRGAACKRWPGQQLSLDATTVREALRDGGFMGREAVLVLPAGAVRSLDETIAPERKPFITAAMQTLAGTGLRLVGVRPLPIVLCEMSRQIFRRADELGCTALHVHLAESTTLITIAAAGEVSHVETFDFARPNVVAAMTSELSETHAAADELRERLLHAAASIDWHFDRTLIHRPAAGQIGHPLDPCGDESARLVERSAAMQRVVATAVRPLLDRLVSLQASAAVSIDRLIFSGSESMDRSLCETIAKRMGLPAHIADPILRMRAGNTRELVGGIDRRLPQPAWVAAIGASIGASKVVTQ